MYNRYEASESLFFASGGASLNISQEDYTLPCLGDTVQLILAKDQWYDYVGGVLMRWKLRLFKCSTFHIFIR